LPPTEYLSVSQAAKRKGVTRSAIYQAVNSGKLPHTLIADKIALKAKDVDAYTPIPLDQRKGVRLGGKQRKPGADSNKSRARRKEAHASEQKSAENGAQGQELVSSKEG